MRVRSAVLTVSLALPLAAPAPAQTPFTPARLVSAWAPPSPIGAQSGGIAAFDVTLDERGSVTGVDAVQAFAPYGDLLGEALRGWTFEPARDQGKAVRSRVLVLGFFRPPELAVIAPPRPRYKDAVAPPELPWPTSVTVPPYPPNALGSGMVILEVDVTAEGKVARSRVLNPGSPFDSAAMGAAQAWVFRPASRNGHPSPTRAFFIFSFIGTTR